jgi:tripartite ATP-independent transporter DctP family solute receptor
MFSPDLFRSRHACRPVLILTLILNGCGGGGPSGPEVLDIQIGAVSAPGSLISATAEEFARRVNERLAGKVHVTFFGSSQLGNDEVMLQKLKLGTMDFSVPSTIMSSTVDEFGLFEMPYLIKDRDHMRLVKEEIFWPTMEPAAEAKGYKVLALWENGFRHITNNTRAINVPADLEGVKLRTPRGQWRVKLFQTFGANPTPMPLSEVFVALQTGVIDGQENPLAQVTSFRFEEVQTYLSLTGHVYSPAYLLTGLTHWKQLPEDVRRVLEETGREMEDYVHAEAERLDQRLLEALRGSGIQINEADRDSFLEASRPIYEEFGSTVPGGREMIETAIRLADPRE